MISDGTNRAMTVNTSGSGVTTFGGNVGGDGSAGQHIASLTTNADGTVQLGGAVSATGDVLFNEVVTLTSDVTITGNDVTFSDDVVSDSTTNRSLTVKAESAGVTNFAAGIGGTTAGQRLNTVTTNSDGTTRIRPATHGPARHAKLRRRGRAELRCDGRFDRGRRSVLLDPRQRRHRACGDRELRG